MTSIVILSFNTLDYLKLCIESVRKYTPKNHYELIVVENGSTDGSAKWLISQPHIKCIFNGRNEGFPKGCNQGMRRAKGDSMLLLNSDAVVTQNWLGNMLKALYSSEMVGAVGCMTNYARPPQRLNMDPPHMTILKKCSHSHGSTIKAILQSG